MEDRKRVGRVMKVGKVKSRNNYPTEIKHAGISIMLSPRGSTECDMHLNKLDPLPKGVVFIEN